jgi:hypothetical protein
MVSEPLAVQRIPHQGSTEAAEAAVTVEEVPEAT